MVITLAYLYVFLLRWIRRRANDMKKLQLLRTICDGLKCSSVRLQRISKADVSESVRSSSASSLWADVLKNVHPSNTVDASSTKVLFETDSYHVCSAEPKLSISLTGWTPYLANEKSAAAVSQTKGFFHIILELSKLSKEEEDQEEMFKKQETKLEDLVNLIAWRSGRPFQVVAQCTEENFSCLAKSFVDNTLVTEERLRVLAVTSVDISQQPDNTIPTTKSHLTSSSSPVERHSSPRGVSFSKPHDLAVNSPSSPSRETATPESAYSSSNICEEVNQADVESQENFLKSSQVDRVLQEENFDTYSDSDCAGEAPAEPLEDLAPEMLTPVARRANLQGKPPNILIYCGKKDSSRLFEKVCAVFAQCINRDRYTIYHLKHDNVKTTPWLDNTMMLIISSDKVYDGVDEVFLRYFLGGGTVVSFGSLFDAKFLARIQTGPKSSILTLCYERWVDATFICGRHVYEPDLQSLLYDVTLTSLAMEKQKNSPVIVEAVHETSGGIALLSQVSLDKDPSEMAISTDIFTILKQSNAVRFEVLRSLFGRLGVDCEQPALPPLTPLVLLTSDSESRRLFLKSVTFRLKDGHLVSRDVTLQFIPDESSCSDLNVTSSLVPVVMSSDRIPVKFDYNEYKANLKTEVLGNVMLYADVVTTTMNFFESMMFSVPSRVGLVAVARRQTGGLGRGGNTWLSPPGCAMFSLHVRVPLTSWLGERIPFLQHMMSLAVVLAVRQKPGYENIDLKIKWPNDVYFGANMKLGGILVKSSIMNNVIHANIGCGVNVANKDPTICINDLIQTFNENTRENADRLPLLSVEEVIARSITILEELITKFQTEGPDHFKEVYYRYWLHGNQSVHLNTEDGPLATVVGLDEYGFLVVRLSDGQTRSVQPDGNSFDMMKNLIAPKSN